jgi:hypothetical protein
MKMLIARALITAPYLKHEIENLRVMLTQFLRGRFEKRLGTQAGGKLGGRFEGLNDYHVCSDRLAMEMTFGIRADASGRLESRRGSYVGN